VVSGGIECPNHTVGKCPGVNWGTFSTFKYQTVFQEFSACFGCGFPQEVCMTGVSGCAKCRTGTGQKPPPVPPQPQQAPLPPPPLHPEHLDGAAPSSFAAGAKSMAHWEAHYQQREQNHTAFLQGGFEAANLKGLAELLKTFQEQLQEKDAARQVEVEVLRGTIESLKVENARLIERAAQLSAELAHARQLPPTGNIKSERV
jgi:hypothetical protein